jgi:hypothetical protein
MPMATAMATVKTGIGSDNYFTQLATFTSFRASYRGHEKGSRSLFRQPVNTARCLRKTQRRPGLGVNTFTDQDLLCQLPKTRRLPQKVFRFLGEKVP